MYIEAKLINVCFERKLEVDQIIASADNLLIRNKRKQAFPKHKVAFSLRECDFRHQSNAISSKNP